MLLNVQSIVIGGIFSCAKQTDASEKQYHYCYRFGFHELSSAIAFAPITHAFLPGDGCCEFATRYRMQDKMPGE